MAQVTIFVGSSSDRPVIDSAIDVLKKLGISFDLYVCSAHRDPARLVKLIKTSEESGTMVFIAAAGMAAHLAGAVSANTIKPVIGIPIASGALSGHDALLSTAMMPPGIPVATVAIDGGKNAAWLAAQIIASSSGNEELKNKLLAERETVRKKLIDDQEKWVNSL